MLNETRQLLTTAKFAIAEIDQDLDAMPMERRLLVVRECSRLTARLTAVLSWLLARKAVVSGELAADDPRAVCDLFGIGDERVDPEFSPDVAIWPGPLGSLLDDSADLFARAMRLDQRTKTKRMPDHE